MTAAPVDYGWRDCRWLLSSRPWVPLCLGRLMARVGWRCDVDGMFFEHKMNGGWRRSLCVVAWLGWALLGGAAEIHDAVMAHDLERVRRLAQANPKVVNQLLKQALEA